MISVLHSRMWKRRGTLPKLPKFFIDRSLGKKKFPQALRKSGVACIILGEYFGEEDGQNIEDTEWLIIAANNGWVAFTKDKEIRNRIAERNIIIERKIKCFCISDPRITWQDMVLWFRNNLKEIEEACQRPGPFIYDIYETHIKEFPLN